MAYRLAKEKGESEEAALLKAVQASRDKARAPMQWENEPFSSANRGFQRQTGFRTQEEKGCIPITKN